MIETTFIRIHVLARMLGLPESWLRAEAEAGRIPHIRAGRLMLFHFETVERVLLAASIRDIEEVSV